MSIAVRRLWHLFKLAGTRVDLAAPPTQTEQLEGWTTYVCEVDVEDTPELGLGQSARLAQVDFDAAQQVVQFRGIVDHIAASSFEHRVVLTCTGPLARLRRVPSGDHDLTGMTDGQAVQHVLASCNIAYNPADIADAGYVLGAQVPIIWHRDQPGWEIVRELDRVFGMATLEVGDGRVVRFAYDRAPSAALISRTFERGVDATFWRNERDYGALDAIQNVWQITGASWTGPDGCHYTVWARADGPNTAFDSPNVRVRRQDFSSEVIQDQALAEAVARRMMRWYNRQPDEVTITTLNDPNISPGDVVGVIDAVYGIGLQSAAPYLVLTVDRRGQEMRLGCVGGPAGSEGTITSGVERRCNMTSTNTSIPGSYTPPSVGGPPGVPLDPWSCATDGGPEWICPPQQVNTTDPFIDCEHTDGMVGTVPPEWVDESGRASWAHVEGSQWRVVNDTDVSVHVDAAGNVDEILIHGNYPAFFWNDTPGTNAAKSATNDRIVGAAPSLVVSGEVWFGNTGQRLTIKLDHDTGRPPAVVTLYADPGLYVSASNEGEHYWAVDARTENHSAQWSDSYPPGQCPHATNACNNGGRMGKDMGFATGMWIPFSIAFALGGTEQRVYVTAGGVGGYIEDFPCWPYPSPCWFSFGNTACPTPHRLVISSTLVGGTPSNPGMKLRLLGMGHTTCQPNPDYIPPSRGG